MRRPLLEMAEVILGAWRCSQCISTQDCEQQDVSGQYLSDGQGRGKRKVKSYTMWCVRQEMEAQRLGGDQERKEKAEELE